MSPASTPHGYPYPLGTDRLADGDESMRDLALAVDDKLGVWASGQVNMPITAANTNVQVAVTFPAGRFTVAPKAVVTARNNAPFQVRSAVHPTPAPSTTGMTVNAIRDSGSAAFNVDWLAVYAP